MATQAWLCKEKRKNPVAVVVIADVAAVAAIWYIMLAGAGKLAWLSGTATEISRLVGLPSSWARIVTIGLSAAEIVGGGCTLCGALNLRLMSAISAAFVGGGVLFGFARRTDGPCICFGAYDGSGSAHRVEWAADAVVVMAGIAGTLRGRSPIPAPRLLLLITGFAVAAVCVVVRTMPRWLNGLEVE